MRRAAWAAAAVLAMTACGNGGDSGDTAAATRTDRVRLPKSYKFEPAAIAVSPGTTVTWTNEDDFPHDVSLLDGTKEKRALPIGKSASITFANAGTYRYQCSIHPQQMRGTIVVG